MNASFAPLTAESAPPAARPLVAASQKRFGFVPSPIAKAARSPALLAHLLAGFGAFDRSSLSADEREVVALTVATRNGCEYCVAMHSATLWRDPERRALATALRTGAPLPDARLDALRAYAAAVHEGHGDASDEARARFAAAGYTEENALDVVLGVGVYELSTVTNILTGAELDPAFEDFRWARGDAR